jgi:hypothetical protein
VVRTSVLRASVVRALCPGVVGGHWGPPISRKGGRDSVTVTALAVLASCASAVRASVWRASVVTWGSGGEASSPVKVTLVTCGSHHPRSL